MIGCASLLLTAVIGGCDDGSAPPTLAIELPETPPTTVIQQMRALRDQRQYTALVEKVVPPARHEIRNALMAADAFLDANDRLCRWIRDNVGLGLSRTIDQSELAGVFGIFSPEVELLDEVIARDRATVSFTVGATLPAQQAEFRLINGAWQYDPGPGYSELLPDAFRKMAAGLDSVRGDLEKGEFATDELLDNPEPLMRRVMARLRAGVEILSEARAAGESGADR